VLQNFDVSWILLKLYALAKTRQTRNRLFCFGAPEGVRTRKGRSVKQNGPDVIHISYCPFRSGRRCLNIIHAYKPDPRSCLELLFKPLNFISVVYHLVRQFVMTAFYYSVSTSIDGFHPSLLTNNPLPGKERGV